MKHRSINTSYKPLKLTLQSRSTSALRVLLCLLLNFGPGDLKLGLQCGCIGEADEAKQRSSPMAEGQTWARSAEGLQ